MASAGFKRNLAGCCSRDLIVHSAIGMMHNSITSMVELIHETIRDWNIDLCLIVLNKSEVNEEKY